MKNVILSLLFVSLSSPASASVELICRSNRVFGDGNYHDVKDASNFNLAVRESVAFQCSSNRFSPHFTTETLTGIDPRLDQVTYYGELEGKGLGARWTGWEGFTIICPTVRRKALGVESFEVTKRNGEKRTRKGTKNFYGIKASVGLVFGLDGAVFANGRGGVCVLGGAQFLTAGFGVSGMKLNIERD